MTAPSNPLVGRAARRLGFLVFPACALASLGCGPVTSRSMVRDQFAAAYAQALVSRGNEPAPAELAKKAYDFADEMLRERHTRLDPAEREEEGPLTGGSGATASAGGEMAPDFTLKNMDGQSVSLSDFKGKTVLVNFWSTVCDPCLVEMPHIVELYQKYKDRGFVVLAISLDGPETVGLVRNVASAKSMSFPVLIDEETTAVVKFNPKRDMPFNVIIDPSGRVVFKRGGDTAGDEATLKNEVEKALGVAGGADKPPAGK